MDKTRQWTLFAVLGVVAVLLLGWLAVISPERAHAKSLRDQAAEQATTNDSLQVQVESLRSRSKDLPAKQARLDAIKARIPDTPALPRLIRLLSSAADDSGVELVSLKPSVPAAVTTAATTTTAASAASAAPVATGPQLQQIPIVIEVKGGFYDVEQFDAALEDLDRALVVDGFDVQAPAPAAAGAASAPGATAHDDRLDAKINARVFMTAPAPVATTLTPKTAAPAGK